MFLIPVAVVGYRMYDEHQKRERSKRVRTLEMPNDTKDDNNTDGDEPETNPSLLVAQESDGSDLISLETTEEPYATDLLKFNWPFGGIRKFIANIAEEHQRSIENDPFCVNVNREKLVYEVLGNRDENALPFPKIAFK